MTKVGISNIGLAEIYRIILSLYEKQAIDKNDVQEFLNELKLTLNKLPESDKIYLH